MSFPEKSCFISALLHKNSPLLKTASLVLCARRASCAPGLGTLDLLWGNLWSLPGASLFCGACETLTALPALTVLGSATTSVGRPGFLCCLCRGAHNKGKNCCKSKNLQNQRNCVTSQHLWLQGLSSLWLLGVRATLPCWIAPSSLWVGWGFCAILMHSLTFGELSPGQACWSGASDNAGRLKSPLTPLHDSCIPLHVPQSPGR